MSDAESIGPRRGLGSKVARILAASVTKKDDSLEPPKPFFNPEDDIIQKREWTVRQRQAAVASTETVRKLEPSRIFEHFCIVGLPPSINIKAVCADIRTYHTARRAGGAGMESIVRDASPGAPLQYGLRGPAFPAQILYSYPSVPSLPADLAANLASFCHPHGVRPTLLERTPSLSGLNEVLFGQPLQSHPDHSFVFLMHVASPGLERLDRMASLAQEAAAGLYPGPAAIARFSSGAETYVGGKGYNVTYSSHSLTEVESTTDTESPSVHGSVGGFATPLGQPEDFSEAFLEVHLEQAARRANNSARTYQVHANPGPDENSPLASSSSMGSDYETPSAPLLQPHTPFFTPAPGTIAHTATGRRTTRHHGVISPHLYGGDASADLLDIPEASSPDGLVANGNGPVTELENRVEKVRRVLDDSMVTLNARLKESSPEKERRQSVGDSNVIVDVTPARASANGVDKKELVDNTEDLGEFLAERLTLEVDVAVCHGGDLVTDYIDDVLLSTAAGASPIAVHDEMATPDPTPAPLEAVEILQRYQNVPVPDPGNSLEFSPDPDLPTLSYLRPHPSELLRDLGLRPSAAVLPDLDAVHALSVGSVTSLCRSLSLDSILAFLTAVLLERQVVVFCPNVGLLSSIVLSMIPMLLPFSWQSLLLPILPATPSSQLDLLDAPVPFVVGVLYKTPEVRSRCKGLVRVNVYKDRVRNAGAMPPLPQVAALTEALAGPHAELARLGSVGSTASPAVHTVMEEQGELTQCFLSTLQKYLRSLVMDLKGYTITDVSEDQRVSVLLKESFIDSFPFRDRPFMHQFAETQMFSVYCDSVL